MALLNDMHTDWNKRDDDHRPGLVTLHTDGKTSYWSEVAKPVRVTALSLGYVNDELDFGELRVHFNTKDWRVDQDGLIYTDKRFEKELRRYLNSIGLPGNDVSYSEQGMQGDNYVSCDVGKKFLKAMCKRDPAYVKQCSQD